MKKAFNNRRQFITYVFHHLVSGFKAAIFVASCVVILGHYHLLDDLEIDVLQLAMPQAYSGSQKLPDKDSNKLDSAKIITIDDELYENTFKQASPLDRDKLREIIEAILDKKPKVLAIDLDLSPSPPIKTENAEKEDADVRLKKLLIETAKKRKENSSGTEIVLITPVKVLTTDSIKRKTEWMREMCDGGINFGLPYIYSNNGVVVKHLDDFNMFANQIYLSARNQDVHSSEGHGNKSTAKEHSQRICDYSDDELIQFVSKRSSPKVSSKLKLLNYKFINHIERVGKANVKEINEIDQEDLAGQVVFLGGSYGVTDKYKTPAGPFDGVYLHAASFYSMVKPTGEFLHVLEYLMEIIMSTILGTLFYMLAGWYRTTRSLFSIATNIGLQPLLMFVFIKIAGYSLLFWNTWLNPATLIVGMEIHAFVESIGEPHTEVDDTRRLLGIRERFIKQCFYYGVICIAWYFIAKEMQHH